MAEKKDSPVHNVTDLPAQEEKRKINWKKIGKYGAAASGVVLLAFGAAKLASPPAQETVTPDEDPTPSDD